MKIPVIANTNEFLHQQLIRISRHRSEVKIIACPSLASGSKHLERHLCITTIGTPHIGKLTQGGSSLIPAISGDQPRNSLLTVAGRCPIDARKHVNKVLRSPTFIEVHLNLSLSQIIEGLLDIQLLRPIGSEHLVGISLLLDLKAAQYFGTDLTDTFGRLIIHHIVRSDDVHPLWREVDRHQLRHPIHRDMELARQTKDGDVRFLTTELQWRESLTIEGITYGLDLSEIFFWFFIEAGQDELVLTIDPSENNLLTIRRNVLQTKFEVPL